MNLTLDIGNSRTKVCVFDGDEIAFSECYTTLKTEILESLANQFQIENAIICAVAFYNDDLLQWLNSHINRVVVLGSDTPLPIKNEYATPETLGLDRIASVIGAYKQKHGYPLLVIDAGTAITYDFLSADGVYRGGNIAPGAVTRFRSLNAYTDKLPLVSLNEKRRNSLLGTDTRSAILDGVIYGIIFEIEGYIASLKEKNPDLQVFFTGGDAIFFENYIKNSIFVVSNLNAIGLNEILTYNL
ncbi:MAG: type III pantothenate kinase [Paludibacteraceae bacterium]|nr:type III pantothenate kinase [Paludibacteraceae bacterium]